jgi:hypothetical protein
MIVQRKNMFYSPEHQGQHRHHNCEEKKKKTQLHAHSKASITRENFTEDFQQEPKRRTYLLLTRKSKPSQPSKLQKPVAQFIEDEKRDFQEPEERP